VRAHSQGSVGSTRWQWINGGQPTSVVPSTWRLYCLLVPSMATAFSVVVGQLTLTSGKTYPQGLGSESKRVTACAMPADSLFDLVYVAVSGWMDCLSPGCDGQTNVRLHCRSKCCFCQTAAGAAAAAVHLLAVALWWF
jgi:hypothetical protein